MYVSVGGISIENRQSHLKMRGVFTILPNSISRSLRFFLLKHLNHQDIPYLAKLKAEIRYVRVLTVTHINLMNNPKHLTFKWP